MFAGALLAAGAVPPDLDASDEAPAPIVVHADAWQPQDVPEAMSLAARLLRREGIEPPPTEAARRTPARETYVPPEGVILTLEPGLLGSVSRLLGDRGAPVTLRTGHVRFDALNAELGLKAVEVFPSFGAVAFFFDPPFDVFSAIFYYSWIDEVLSAEPNEYMGDGPELRLSRSEKAWKPVRHADGQAVRGCRAQNRERRPPVCSLGRRSRTVGTGSILVVPRRIAVSAAARFP